MQSFRIIHWIALLFCSLLLAGQLAAQVAVNQDNSSPDPSAMLDVKSTDKGLLIPRLSSAQRTSIAAPATGLMVFDNTTDSFWYYNGTAWKEITLNTDDQTLSLSGTMLSIEDGNSVELSGLSAANSWSQTGNAGTTNGVDFIGTTDNVALDFRVNNQRGLRLIPKDDNSVNVIGGYSGNSISAGANSATIAGGGSPGSANSVTAYGGTVGGGTGNTVSETSSVVSGGEANTASGEGSTVAGGILNTASGNGATVAGGEENQATGNYSFAAGLAARALHPGSFVWNGDSDYSPFSSTANKQFLIKAPGGVGIGLNNPSEALEVNGNVRANAFLTPSSRRWKTNIQTFENALETVQQLRGVTYDWKETGKHDIGLIAEEVGAVIPEVVRFEANGTDVQSVDYPRLVAVLIEAVKTQQSEITALQAQNKAFEQRLLKLEAACQQVQAENSNSKK
ncbi:MAG: tail fiber domain-containing protein [Lewinellaceae bacterium]|nr:tail fiber domain-containing protein [Lewinellaceae bacterium]